MKHTLGILSFFLSLFLVSSLCSDNQVDINSANLLELQRIKGIGPVYAQMIIDNRPFKSLDDLLKIKGIGNKTLEKIKGQGIACVGEYDSSFLVEKSEEKKSDYYEDDVTNKNGFLKRKLSKNTSFNSLSSGEKNNLSFHIEEKKFNNENYGEPLFLNEAEKEELVYRSNFDKAYKFLIYLFFLFSVITIIVALRD